MGNRLKQKTFSVLMSNRQVPGSSPGLGSIAIVFDQLDILGLQGMGAGRAVNVV